MQCQKHLFSLDPNIHYLNNAYKGPLLKQAEDACLAALHRNRNPQQIGVPDFFHNISAIRNQFARLVNVHPKQTAIIPSTSYAFRSALANITGKKDGTALITEDEFPSAYYALERWCQEQDNELITIKRSNHTNTADWNEEIVKRITNKTSVVVVSSVHWMTGSRFDLPAISKRCQKKGAKLLVDGTQSVGAVPFDIQQIPVDALICAGYKWLFGPYSLGVAYMSEAFNEGKPIEDSWMNKPNAQNFQHLTNYDTGYPEGAGRYSIGETSNFLLTPILKAGLIQINEWTPHFINQYCGNLIQPLLEFLDTTPISRESDDWFSNHLFGLELPDGMNLGQLKQTLAERNIYVSLRGNYVRVSVNVFNDEEDINALIKAIQEVL